MTLNSLSLAIITFFNVLEKMLYESVARQGLRLPYTLQLSVYELTMQYSLYYQKSPSSICLEREDTSLVLDIFMLSPFFIY